MGAIVPLPILPNTDVGVKDKRPIIDHNSKYEANTESATRLTMGARVSALGLGISICTSVPISGFVNAPFTPWGARGFAHSVFGDLNLYAEDLAKAPGCLYGDGW